VARRSTQALILKFKVSHKRTNKCTH